MSLKHFSATSHIVNISYLPIDRVAITSEYVSKLTVRKGIWMSFGNQSSYSITTNLNGNILVNMHDHGQPLVDVVLEFMCVEVTNLT